MLPMHFSTNLTLNCDSNHFHCCQMHLLLLLIGYLLFFLNDQHHQCIHKKAKKITKKTVSLFSLTAWKTSNWAWKRTTVVQHGVNPLVNLVHKSLWVVSVPNGTYFSTTCSLGRLMVFVSLLAMHLYDCRRRN